MTPSPFTHAQMRPRLPSVQIARHLMCFGWLAMTASCGESLRNEIAPVYDLVIVNGTVMDPASGLNAPRDVGISGGAIRAVTEQRLQGRDTLDARGMVVAPGFIDLHQHAQDPAGYRAAVLDGTTTALELEGGTVDIDRWYAARASTSLVNHGVSIGHDHVRMQVMRDPGK